MANELQPLSLLFQNRLFRIPDYQRGYAWKQAQLVDFWDDLVNLQDGRYHYTGLLSLKTLKRNDLDSWGTDTWMIDKGFKPCHILDGQQRLTTFIILLNEVAEFVRSLDENRGKSDENIILGDDTLAEVVAKYICKHRPSNNQIITYLFGYEVDNPSAEYLRHKIFNEPFSGAVHETYYTKNLKFAKAFFRENLDALYVEERMDGINNLYLKLTLRLMFNIHEIDDDYDVFVAFETMNNRGKKLTNLELLKNRLIYLTTLYSDDKFDELDKDNLRKQINEAWKEAYYQLGRNESVLLSDDDFLRAHWISYFSYSRKKGDDYIHFLLNKFSAKNIFEKKTVVVEQEVSTFDYSEVEDFDEDVNETETVEIAVSKLQPDEISLYVNSLKDMAKYWYDTFFPIQSDNLTTEEKIWVDRLNRIGIGHFRPLVMVLISRRDILTDKRVEVFKAIERFIFICFRLGYFNATYKSSEYYRAARSIYLKQMDVDELLVDITDSTNINIEYALPNFVTKIEKLFDDLRGFYYWNSIKYFLFEYELQLAQKNNLDKMSWSVFTKTEKDKLTVEHILPQTPSKHYWKNQFRQFNLEEIELLSCALGNLLPLSHSINSSLQNDSFHDKKTSKDGGRRGYENGSHSEIEVAKETDWTADRIYKRSKKLLSFMERRWQFSFTQEQMDDLIYVSFAMDGREIPEELPNESGNVDSKETTETKKTKVSVVLGTDLERQRQNFWSEFITFCNEQGYGDVIARREASTECWYAVSLGTSDLHIEFTVTRSKYLSVLIYAENSEVFARLESKKNEIESAFGNKLDWYSSRQGSDAKRIIYKKECNVFDSALRVELYSWMIDKFNKLCNALSTVGEIDKIGRGESNKFSALRKYLDECDRTELTLSFSDIEEILGTSLCKSAYSYAAYWKPSDTHILPNIIIDAGYQIELVDLLQEIVQLKKQ